MKVKSIGNVSENFLLIANSIANGYQTSENGACTIFLEFEFKTSKEIKPEPKLENVIFDTMSRALELPGCKVTGSCKYEGKDYSFTGQFFSGQYSHFELELTPA